ncbi:MAG: YbaK/EbsC family protein, partial [Actinomycetes bacterium]
MAYGGITPVGLPDGWPVLIDSAVAGADWVVVGSGIRGSKLAVPGPVLAALPAAVVLEGLGQPLPPAVESPPATRPPGERASDDSDVGWGERAPESDDERRYLEDRPPHWGSD